MLREVHGGSHTPCDLFRLSRVPDRGDDDALATDAVEDGIGSATDDQLTNTSLGSGAAQVRVIPQSLNHGHDSCGQMFRRVGLVQRDIGTNLRKACARQW